MTTTYQYSIDRHRIVRHKFNNSPNGSGYYYEEIIIPQQILLPWYQQPGLVISVPKGIVNHFGIVTNRLINGLPTVISNSGRWGKVVEETWWNFTERQRITVHWGTTPEWRLWVVDRAYSLKEHPYSLFSSNCEHFVRKVYGFREESPQLQAGVALSAIAAVVLYAITTDN